MKRDVMGRLEDAVKVLDKLTPDQLPAVSTVEDANTWRSEAFALLDALEAIGRAQRVGVQ